MIQRTRKMMGQRFLEILGRSEPDWEIALSFAVGVAISFSPFIGLHFFIALVAAWVLRLNKVDVIIGTLIPVNPWTIVPIYSAATALGWWILHPGEPSPMAEVPWKELATLSYWRSHDIAHWKPYLWSLALGSTIFSAVAGTLTYLVIVRAIRSHRRKKLAEATGFEGNGGETSEPVAPASE